MWASRLKPGGEGAAVRAGTPTAKRRQAAEMTRSKIVEPKDFVNREPVEDVREDEAMFKEKHQIVKNEIFEAEGSKREGTMRRLWTRENMQKALEGSESLESLEKAVERYRQEVYTKDQAL